MKKIFISKNIKKLRLFKNMSQEEFATLFEIKRGALGSYEEGRAEPKLEFLIRVATYFKLSIDDLVLTELTVNKIANFNVDYNQPIDNLEVLKEEFSQFRKQLNSIEAQLKKLNNE